MSNRNLKIYFMCLHITWILGLKDDNMIFHQITVFQCVFASEIRILLTFIPILKVTLVYEQIHQHQQKNTIREVESLVLLISLNYFELKLPTIWYVCCTKKIDNSHIIWIRNNNIKNNKFSNILGICKHAFFFFYFQV